MLIAILLYDSIGFVFRYHYILSIKVNYSPCLVYLHQIMDTLFSPLPFKGLSLSSLNNFGGICNKTLGV